MEFQSKPFKLGNSVAIYIPKEVNKALKLGVVYTFKVLLEGEGESQKPPRVVVNSDNSGIDVHIPRFTFHNPKNKSLVFNDKLGIDEWV